MEKSLRNIDSIIAAISDMQKQQQQPATPPHKSFTQAESFMPPIFKPVDKMQPIINSITAILTQYPVKRAALFGSSARLERTETSDIDMIVEFLPDTWKNIIRMRERAAHG